MIFSLSLFCYCRQIAPAYAKVNGGTAIPLPATVMVQRRCPPDKVRPLPPTPNHTPCKWIRFQGGGGLYLLKSAWRRGEGTSWATLNVCWLFTAHKQISVQPAQQQPPTGAGTGHANALSLQPKLVELSTKRGKRKYACPMWHHQSAPGECLLCGLCQ